jgi:hypothetical protein
MACAWRDGCRCGPLLFKHLRSGHIGHLRMRSSMPIRYWRPASGSSPHGKSMSIAPSYASGSDARVTVLRRAVPVTHSTGRPRARAVAPSRVSDQPPSYERVCRRLAVRCQAGVHPLLIEAALTWRSAGK